MTFFDLKHIFDKTELLPYSERVKGFSEGVMIIAKYVQSDFSNTDAEIISDHNGYKHFQLWYGDLDELLPVITENDAKRLFELGWHLPLKPSVNFLTYML